VSEAADAMQPNVSPNGKRIAFWGLRGNSGQRDLFTVAADGSESKGNGQDVTNDAALDWSPTWSPDGKWLWFSSNRGGAMNLWRVPIDEASGRVLGEPEAMTTPSLWSGEISFSRDGTKLAYGSLHWRSALLRVAFDPKEERTVGAPMPILKSTQVIRDHRLSPDGQWVVFNQITSQEDIALARVDGTEYRRLTDDKFRDRGPAFSPDGKEIVFYSDRGGSYQVWTIRPDGSALAQLVAVDGAANLPLYSPDGKTMAFSSIWAASQTGGFVMADLTSSARPIPGRKVDTPEIGDKSFWPTSWSRDGKRLAGVVVRRNGTVAATAYYDFDARKIRLVTEGGDQNWKTLAWLADGRRVLVRDKHGISLLDTETKASKLLVDVGGYFVGVSVGISPDDRSITYTETATEGDVWIAKLK
jgi:Tol biopolymer transport system component